MSKIDIFLSISRPERIQAMSNQINALDLATHDVELICVIDNPLIKHETIVGAFAPLLVKAASMDRPADDETNIDIRRTRVAQVFETGASMVRPDCDYVLTIEDDMEFNSDTLKVLEEQISKDTNIGIVSGIAAGRWAYKLIGGWKCDFLDNPTLVESIKFDFDPKTNTKVMASGFYMMMTRADLFRNAKFHHGDVFPLGPDVHYGYDVSKAGYEVQMCWKVICGHIKDGQVIFPDDYCVSVRYDKIDGYWVQNQEIYRPSAEVFAV
mgnify:FL=1